MDTDLLVFELDEQPFGIRALLVSEVLRAVTPIAVPHAPKVVLGIINLRGMMVPVLSARRLLGWEFREVHHGHHFVVVSENDLTFALHVDQAIDLCRSPAEGREGAAAKSEKLVVNYDSSFLQVIEPVRLLGSEDHESLRHIINSMVTRERSMK